MNQAINIERLKASCNLCTLSELCFPHGMDNADMDELNKAVGRTEAVHSGEFLYKEGDSCVALYAVRSGSIKTIKQNASGESQIVGFHLAGELIGFDGFATDKHLCTAQFLETSSVCELPLESLDTLCHTIPGLQQKVRRIMGLEVNSEQDLLLLLGQMSADEKLATFLLNLSARMKERHWKELEFNLCMPRQDIANYLGVAVETVSRLFAQFQDKGLIDVDKRRVKILDMGKLKEIVVECNDNSRVK